jgi:hypothetical protein
MNDIFIVLTYTGTLLSKIIRFFKHAKYCHASISLDQQLTQLYSFGRKNPYNAFFGSIINEGIHKGTFKRFNKTYCKVLKLTINDKQHQLMLDEIERMMSEKAKYKFNTFGLCVAAFNIKLNRPYHFYCSEFVKYILETGKVDTDKLPKTLQPEQLLMLNGLEVIYEGLLVNYPYQFSAFDSFEKKQVLQYK